MAAQSTGVVFSIRTRALRAAIRMIAYASRRRVASRSLRREAVGKCGKSAILGLGGGSAEPCHVSVAVRRCQAVLAIQWLWSLSRLWVAVTNRHSDCAAALPLRMNRSMCRLYLICPYTGSIVILRWA